MSESVEAEFTILRISWREAEEMLGHRVDRRCAYAKRSDGQSYDEHIDTKVLQLGQWTTSCSGCYETEDGHPVGHYPLDKHGIPIGAGCHECGYTGKRRTAMWLPYMREDPDI